MSEMMPDGALVTMWCYWGNHQEDKMQSQAVKCVIRRLFVWPLWSLRTTMS